MTLRFHNTLTGAKEDFVPLEPGRVRMYTCGPTVHDRIHVGNFRTFLFEDLLRRTLRWAGYEVAQVMNITDVDDKIIRKAREAGVTIGTYTAAYTRLFFEDAARLNIEPAEHYPRATAYVPQMVRLIERLQVGGHTYERDGSIYFRIASFPAYGRLSGVDLSGCRDGARVDADEYGKDDPKDFVLWKAAKPGEDAWDTPLGRGRPGWHVECSAMAMELLGESFDIHTGGVDNIFPHHENEIAQSEAATGRLFARTWLHAQHLTVGDTKMAKSLGNFVTLGELLERGHDPLAVRYLLISAQYRTPLRFTEEGLAQAAAALERLRDLRGRLAETAGAAAPSQDADPVVEEAEEGFREGLADDLNTPRALAAVFGFVRASNTLLDDGMEPARAAAHLAALMRWDRVLGVLGEGPSAEPPEVAALVREREDARSRRDFARSDEIRRALQERGWLVEDTPSGPRLKRVPVA